MKKIFLFVSILLLTITHFLPFGVSDIIFDDVPVTAGDFVATGKMLILK